MKKLESAAKGARGALHLLHVVSDRVQQSGRGRAGSPTKAVILSSLKGIATGSSIYAAFHVSGFLLERLNDVMPLKHADAFNFFLKAHHWGSVFAALAGIFIVTLFELRQTLREIDEASSDPVRHDFSHADAGTP